MIRRLMLKLFRRRMLEHDLEAEMAFHREMAAAGGNPIPFGNAAYIREQAFDLWRFNRVENLWRDLVYAVRSLRRSPGFVAAALLSLGLGIGINTAIFSLSVEFLLSEPSVRDAGSLVYVRQDGNSHMQPATIEALRRSGFFADVTGQNEETFINFNNGSETTRIFALQGSKTYFEVLGIPLSQGRGWTQSDSNEVVVLHPRFWRSRLGGDPAILGKKIRLDGRLYTVIGILPEHFRSLVGYGYAPDVFVPRYIDDTILAAYARMKPGMSVSQLNAAMPTLGQWMDHELTSRSEKPSVFHATPVAGMARLQKDGDALVVGLFFAVLLVVVGLVLLIACVNVAGLLLARASVRRQEIAIRIALGASRGRLLQQLLAESLLLSLTGAGLGFVIALVAAKAAAAVPMPFPVPIHLQIEPDWRVATYAALLAVGSTLASGLMPAWQSVRESLAAGLHRERKLRLRRALVVAQIAVSFVVLTAAALFLQNLLRAGAMGPGFDVRKTVRADVYLPPNVYKDGRTIRPYIARSLEALRAVPGVEYATAARIIPFTDSTNFGIDLTFPDNGERVRAQFHWNAVSEDYFRAMEIPVLRGRPFTAQDNASAVIVNDVFVKRYLGSRDPVGVEFRWKKNRPAAHIVAVVKGTKNMTIGEEPAAQLYEPLMQTSDYQPRIQFVVRSAIPPALQLHAVRQALRDVEPAAGLQVETLFSAIGFAFLPSQIGGVLMGSTGVLGLLLAVIGLYGVLAYSVARRTREIGIRMAVGASAGDVSRMVFGEFARLLLTGVALGLAVALLVTRPLGMFFVPGLSPSDPASFAAVALLLGVTGVLAACGPVRRALRVDPLVCLRHD